MTQDLAAKARAFRALHDSGTFIMPNAWDAGSARLLAAAGFSAIGTTSAGVNFSHGRPDTIDGEGRDSMMADYGAIAAAVDLPVSGDLENGYGHRPEDVAETIRASIAHGMVGGGIEDSRRGEASPLFETELAVERIRAAREAADASGIPYTLTARAECYLVGTPEPFAEAVRRVNLYREAGADCLFVPGVKDAETIGRLMREVDGPVNVVMGLAGKPMTVRELADLGVRRISTGGSLARAALGALRSAAQALAQDGTFDYAGDAIPDAEINAFFRSFSSDGP
jgi:2-methylisocitrate lyase-like PEP mutase family enzyme